MKASAVFFTGIMLSTFAMAQQKYQLDSIVSRSVHDGMQTRISKQKYDVDKRLLEWELYLVQPVLEKAEGARHTSKFDERGNELYNTYSRWDLETKRWIEAEKIEKTYDQQDRMISYAEYEMHGGQWRGLARSTQVFDSHTAATVQYTNKDGNWQPTYKNTSRLDNADRELLTINYQWDNLNNDWSNWMKHEYLYLRDSLLKETVTYHWKDGNWVNHEKITYKYVPNSSMVSNRVVYSGTSEGWELKHLMKTSYYQSKKWEEAFYWAAKEGKWKRETLSETYFDRHGRETDFLSMAWSEQAGKYIGQFQRLSLYDDRGRLTLSQEIQFEKGKPKSGMQMSFKFDKDGNLYSEAVHTLDVKTAKWIDQDLREFAFDKGIVLLEEEGDEVLDKARIGYDNIPKNKHAVKEIRHYKLADGKMELQEELTYFYSEIR